MVVTKYTLKSVVSHLVQDKDITEEEILELASEVILEKNNAGVEKIELKVGNNDSVTIEK
ncbi:hypothetical protein [Methanonatronarchaeum sp. AMET-Sl]|uniref:hypothetical protein n=1 Tax=Methanonatronarchaeum sp. AMET-Sl TaxID=3037654 RepID=UPI00244D9E2A|nr:hypothetical protein [Methanonatronarchaeum sp. AMET-Sl]WGI17910.1 hypothetical protein QEN48_02570 [Methanonatronarchaeum sp. AMET-Sl]